MIYSQQTVHRGPNQHTVILSGFGGQGILFAGQLLTYAGMAAGWEVTWIPSYGPEMRGGTANCTVVISDEPIGSPLIRNVRYWVGAMTIGAGSTGPVRISVAQALAGK